MMVRQRATLPGPGWVQVPSLLKSLTSVFEMGTGVTSWLEPPVSKDGILRYRLPKLLLELNNEKCC